MLNIRLDSKMLLNIIKITNYLLHLNNAQDKKTGEKLERLFKKLIKL